MEKKGKGIFITIILLVLLLASTTYLFVTSKTFKTMFPPQEQKTKSGDKVLLDFEGSIDGEVFEGGTAKDYELVLGSKSFIPGFEDQLIGKKVGETVDVNVTFPNDYSKEELRGKPALFKSTIKKIIS